MDGGFFGHDFDILALLLIAPAVMIHYQKRHLSISGMRSHLCLLPVPPIFSRFSTHPHSIDRMSANLIRFSSLEPSFKISKHVFFMHRTMYKNLWLPWFGPQKDAQRNVSTFCSNATVPKFLVFTISR